MADVLLTAELFTGLGTDRMLLNAPYCKVKKQQNQNKGKQPD